MAGKSKKKEQERFKLQLTAGQVTAGPPVGTALGPRGVNIGDFVKQFNERTSKDAGSVVTVEIVVYSDRSFGFEIKSPPCSVLVKKYAQIKKGSGNTPNEMVGSLSHEQVVEIAKIKQPDLSASSLEAAVRTVVGTARSMGVDVTGEAA